MDPAGDDAGTGSAPVTVGVSLLQSLALEGMIPPQTFGDFT